MEPVFGKGITKELPATSSDETTNIVLQAFDVRDTNDILDFAEGGNVNAARNLPWPKSNLMFEVKFFTGTNFKAGAVVGQRS